MSDDTSRARQTSILRGSLSKADSELSRSPMQTRRDFIKTTALTATAAAAGVQLPGIGPAQAAAGEGIRWDKAPCRFCGTGCGVLVGVKGGRMVATQGDPDAPVNRGLNCIKGYFLSKIVYGEDRLTRPLLRKKNGKYDKNGEFTPVSWDEAFDVMAGKFKESLKAKGPTSVGMFGSGQWTVWEGYAAAKLMKAGLRTNNLDPNARHCMASAVAGFIRTFGIDEPMGCYDDLEQADAFVLWGANMTEMHPILWSRLTDRRLTADHVKVAVLSTFENRNFELADLGIVFRPQSDLAILNYIANHIIQSGRVNRDFVAKHVNFRRGNTDIGYGLRPEHPKEKAAANASKAGGSSPCPSRTTRPSSPTTRSRRRARSPVCRPRSSRPWRSSTPTRSARWCPTGPWASTSTRAVPGSTTWSTTCIC